MSSRDRRLSKQHNQRSLDPGLLGFALDPGLLGIRPVSVMLQTYELERLAININIKSHSPHIEDL
jgi:hypothetical protein